jgi:hypothetical protein
VTTLLIVCLINVLPLHDHNYSYVTAQLIRRAALVLELIVPYEKSEACRLIV